MPALALVLIDSLLKVAGGVAIGWLVRDATAAKARSTKTVKAKAKPASAAPSLPARVPRPVEELKMVLCVNMALKMGGGKIGAQCAHAAVGVLRDNYQGPFYVQIKQWEMCAEPKIALKVRSLGIFAHVANRLVGSGATVAAGVRWDTAGPMSTGGAPLGAVFRRSL